MNADIRTVAAIAVVATLVAGGLATPMLFPSAFADEPASYALKKAKDIFPPLFDPSRLKKFDLTFADSVSGEVKRTEYVTKIGFGHRQVVTIVTTPSGTYSTDAMLSPNVRYPGVYVEPKDDDSDFTFGSLTSPRGTWSWTNLSSGSFTYITTNFKPAARAHT